MIVIGDLAVLGPVWVESRLSALRGSVLWGFFIFGAAKDVQVVCMATGVVMLNLSFYLRCVLLGARVLSSLEGSWHRRFRFWS